MKEENIKALRKELEYLLPEQVTKELVYYDNKLTGKINVKDIAKEIYLRRGIDYKKLKKGFFNNLIETISEFSNSFKGKEKETKKKMIIDLIIYLLLLIFIKAPFDLIRDISYDYIAFLSTNDTYFILWHLLFLVLYTIVMLCTLIVLLRNFNKKYKNVK